MGTDKWPGWQVRRERVFSQCYIFGGISFLYILWSKYTRSKSASLRVILSALVHQDVMNFLIKQHKEAVWKILPVFIVGS